MTTGHAFCKIRVQFRLGDCLKWLQVKNDGVTPIGTVVYQKVNPTSGVPGSQSDCGGPRIETADLHPTHPSPPTPIPHKGLPPRAHPGHLIAQVAPYSAV
jgi:hypothetical protein